MQFPPRTAHRRLAALAAVPLLSALLATPASAEPAPAAGGGAADIATVATAKIPQPHLADEVIVQFSPQATAAARATARQSAGAVGSERLSPLAADAEVLKLGRGASVEAAIGALSRNPNVVYAEPNYLLQAAVQSDDPAITDSTLWGMYGDASAPANQFGSQAAEAWSAGYVGSSNVYVVVIDEGIQFTHPDLAGNVWRNPFETPGDGIDNDGNGYIDDIQGWDFVSQDNSVYDGTGDDHATHVAGTIGGVGGNARGVAGVNWDVTMISAKFLGASGGSTADAVKAVDYATDLKTRHGLDIVATSNSWGGGGFSQSLLDAIERGGDQGILFVAAAGNSNVDTDARPHYPSSYRCDLTAAGETRGWDCLISVASITSSGARSSFSNYGSVTVDLGAPGEAIYSTVPSNSYASYSGTSMATPHVSGALALCAAMNPQLGAQQLRSAVLDNVAPTSSMQGITTTGGRLDISAMLPDCAAAPTAGPSGAPSAPTAVAAGTNTVDLSWTDATQAETYHQIQASTDGCVTFSTVAYTGPDTTSETIGGLDPSTAYCFRLRAGNGSGVGAVTVWSDPATATTFDPPPPPPQYSCTPEGYSWTSTAAGTSLSLTDDASATVSIGFSHRFYGQTRTSAKIGSNGLLGFTDDVTAYANTTIPQGGTPNGFVAAFWDDLNPSAGGAVRYLRTGTAPDRRFVASWENVPHFSAGGAVTFQVVLEEATGDIVLVYQDVELGSPVYNNGASATVGVEDVDGATGTLVSFNQASLQPNTAIRCTTSTNPTIVTSSLAPATIGQGYDAPLAVSGGTAPYVWSLASGSLPDGLSLSPAGVISGTPTGAATTSAFTLAVVDADGGTDTAVLTIAVAPAVAITTATLPDGAEGTYYAETLLATGGDGSYTWAAVGLPAGLAISGSAITGTPVADGTSQVTLTVTDGSGRTAQTTLTLTVAPSLRSVSTGQTTTAGSVNGGIEATHVLDGNVQTITEIASGGKPSSRHDLLEHTWTLPVAPGTNTLTVVGRWIDAGDADTGALVGYSSDGGLTWTSLGVITSSMTSLSRTMGVPAASEILVRVTDDDRTPRENSNDSVEIDLVELAGDGQIPPPTIVTGSLADARLGVGYAATLESTGGTAPLRWAVTIGALPTGLGLDEATGTISGTPTALGSFPFTVSLTDDDGRVDSAELTITVVDIPIATTMTATISTGTIGGRDKYGTATVTVTDDLGNPVAGATVQVRFTGDFGDLISASTDASGSTTVTTSTALRRPNFSACVVSLSFGGLTYVPGSEACPAP